MRCHSDPFLGRQWHQIVSIWKIYTGISAYNFLKTFHCATETERERELERDFSYIAWTGHSKPVPGFHNLYWSNFLSVYTRLLN